MPEMRLGYSSVLFDEEDSGLIARETWKIRLIDKKLYVVCRRTSEFLHRLILCAPTGVYVDHKNDDGLDNRRENLRLATNSQNQANRAARRGIIPFKGVTLSQGKTPRPFAQIKVNGKSIYLGIFDLPEDAARAYDAAAREHFGEFANVNFPEVTA